MRVLIADDHSIVRKALGYMVAELGDDVSLSEAQDRDSLFHAVATGGDSLELIILDLHMPGMTGLDDVRQLVGQVGDTPVVIFTVIEDPDAVRRYLDAGVKAFIPKSTDDALIVNILTLVLAGGTYLPPLLHQTAGRIGASTVPTDETVASQTVLDQLTRRQREVIRLMAEGMSNAEIGERLGLNLSTVKTHVGAVLRAFEADNRTQAVLAYRSLRR